MDKAGHNDALIVEQQLKQIEGKLAQDIDNLSTESLNEMNRIEQFEIPMQLREQAQKYKEQVYNYAQTLKKLSHQSYLQLDTLSWAEKAKSKKSWMNQVVKALGNLSTTLDQLIEAKAALDNECDVLIGQCKTLQEVANQNQKWYDKAWKITAGVGSLIVIGTAILVGVVTLGLGAIPVLAVGGVAVGAASCFLSSTSNKNQKQADKCHKTAAISHDTKRQLRAIQSQLEALKKHYEESNDGVNKLDSQDANNDQFFESGEYNTIKQSIEQIMMKLNSLKESSGPMIKRSDAILIPEGQ